MKTSRLLLLSKPTKPPAAIREWFYAGEKGGIWLPFFTKSMFQDAAMSIPAVVGMPVVKMLDLSGNGNTVTFSGVTLQRDTNGKLYLASDGSTSYGSTAAIDFSGTDSMTVVAGLHKASDAAAGAFLELTAAPNTTAGSITVLAPASAAANYGWYSRGDTQRGGEATTYTAPVSSVLVATADISADTAALEIDGVQKVSNAFDQGAGNYANAQVFFFKRNAASVPFNGRMYGVVMCGATRTAGQIASARQYMARLTGVSF